MGLFTGLAIAGALGAGLIGGKAIAGKNKQPVTAPPPSTLGQPPGMPTPPIVDPGAMQAQANAAGQAQRKKAARGAAAASPAMPKAGTMPTKLVPKTLIGGY